MTKLKLTVQVVVDSALLPSRTLLRQWAQLACPGAGEVTLRFVDEEEGRLLNKSYRGKDYATNVLSFPYSVSPSLAGDLVICVPVVLREASEYGKSNDAHFAHLIVHGMLHLQGYDHENEDDAMVMENKERELLQSLGYPDPYL